MSIINSSPTPYGQVLTDIGTLFSGGVGGVSDLSLNAVTLLQLLSGGSSSGSASLQQNHSVSAPVTGIALSAVSFGIAAGIFSAKSLAGSEAILNLSLESSEASFISGAASEVSCFLRTGNEPNQFLNLEAAGASIVSPLDLAREQIIYFKIEGKSNAQIGNALELIQPAPILNEIQAGAFQSKRYKAQLLINNLEVRFKSFRFEKPKNYAGAALNIELSKPLLSQIPSDCIIKFQIGKWNSLTSEFDYYTLIDSGEIDSRNYSLRFLSDSLSFTSLEKITDKFKLCPRRNLIVYDALKTEVNLNDSEKLFDTDGFEVLTVLRNKAVLSLYDLLNVAFVEGCGFDAVETNIPNYEITRCDFSINTSYYETVKPYIGLYKAEFFTVGNVLWALDKTQVIPADFSPRAIPASVSFDLSKPAKEKIDGYELRFAEGSTGTYYQTRTQTPLPVTSGDYGSDSFMQTETVRVWRDWYDFDNPNVILKSELQSEVRRVYRKTGVNLVGRTTENHTFDALGRRTQSKRTIEANVPDLSGGTTFATVRDETRNYFYKTDPFSPRKNILSRTVTSISGMIAVDAENKYFDEDFKQDFTEAHKAGNLAEGMTSEDGAIKTIIEDYEPLGNGQVAVHISGVDHVRDTPLEPFSEIRAGDISLNAQTPRSRRVVVWRTGVDKTAASGNPIPPLSVGEVPLKFARPLAERFLKMNEDQPDAATNAVAGFDESLDRGTFFSVPGRNGDVFGAFLCEGFSIAGADGKMTTTIQSELMPSYE